jgi:SPX domain protein involved in polyphosphate accumulation
MAFTYIFKRIEKKYMLTKEQYEYIIEKIAPHMHTDRFGETVIRNIYFDNTDDELIETSLKKPVYKEKLRLRSYGIPSADSNVFFEIKKKYQGVVYKRRIAMTRDDAYRYIDSGELPEDLIGNIPVEIDYMIRRYRLFPKAFISYKRLALVGDNDPELRITFDSEITSRYNDVRLESTAPGEQLLPENTCLMEIKIPGAMPLWLAHVLSEKNIYPQSFSKFGTAHIRRRQQFLFNQKRCKMAASF